MKNPDAYENILTLLHEQAIHFDKMTEQEALRVLQTQLPWSRLRRYLTNYAPHNGRYEEVDFDDLVAIAGIDIALRQHVLHMATEVEQAIKAALLNVINADNQQNVYQLVKDFAAEEPSIYRKTLSYARNEYVPQRLKNSTIGEFLEHTTFDGLIKMVIFYADQIPQPHPRVLQKIEDFAPAVKQMRNTTAHNHPILADLGIQTVQPSAAFKSVAGQLGLQSHITEPKIHDLFALFYLYQLLLSDEKFLRRSWKEGQHILDMYQRAQAYLAPSSELARFFDAFDKLLKMHRPNTLA